MAARQHADEGGSVNQPLPVAGAGRRYGFGPMAGLLATAVFWAPSTEAHHGVGNFAMDEDIELAGVVTKIDFVNPHSWVHFEMTGADGSKSAHRCELRSATTLRRSGWTPEMFAAGTHITIQGSPDRAEKNACYVSTITFGDGTVLDRYGQRIPANGERPSGNQRGTPATSSSQPIPRKVVPSTPMTTAPGAAPDAPRSLWTA